MLRDRHNKFLNVLIVLIVAGSLAACGEDSEDNKEEGDKTQAVSVQLSWFHQAQFSGFYAALDQKYYEHEGLDVTILNGGINESGYINPMDQVTSEQADFGLASTNEIMKARVAGKPLVAIASTLQRSPRGFVSLAEKNIARPQDLVGKRVAYRPDDDSVYLAMLQMAGVSRDGIIEITDATKFTLEALINDEIDVIPIFVDNEAVSLTQQGFNINIILVSDYGIETYENLIFTTESLIQENPDLVLRFLRATLRGYQYAVEHLNEVAGLAITYDDQLNLETQQASMSRLLPLINPPNSNIGMMQETVWQNAYDILIAQGVLSEPLDVNAAYTLQFLNQIYPS